MSVETKKGYHRMPPMPVFDSLVEKYGTFTVMRKYFDKDMNPKPNAPEGLKRESEMVKTFFA